MRKMRKLSVKGRLLLFSAAVFLLMFIILWYYNSKMRPIIKIMAVSKIEDVATGVINRSVLSELERTQIKYDDIITLEKDSSGYVSAVKTDTILINRFKANVAVTVMEDVTVMENEKVEIPLGSLLDAEFFAGHGPGIPIKIVPVGSVFVDIKQEFLPAGINQTLHRIMMDVKVEADIVLPIEVTTASYVSEFIIAETVIVGNVPGVYANIGAFSDKITEEVEK